MQNDAADELDAEGLHLQNARARLARDGKGLGQHVVQILAVLIALLEEIGLCAKLLCAHGGVGRLQRFDFIDDRIDLFQLVIAVRSEQLFQ